MLADKDLPHKNPAVLKYAMVPGTNNANVFTASHGQKQTKMQFSKLNSTGGGALKGNILCNEACGKCNTASPQDFYPKDTKILKDARDKLKKKAVLTPCPPVTHPPPPESTSTGSTVAVSAEVKVATSLASGAVSVPAVAPMSDTVRGRVGPLTESETAGSVPQPAVLSAATIGTFKNNNRARRATKGARAELVDRRDPGPDINIWKTLLEARRGYHFAQQVLILILKLFAGPGQNPWKELLQNLWTGERCLRCSVQNGRTPTGRPPKGGQEDPAVHSK